MNNQSGRRQYQFTTEKRQRAHDVVMWTEWDWVSGVKYEAWVVFDTVTNERRVFSEFEYEGHSHDKAINHFRTIKHRYDNASLI